jgi:hypothetical protein
MPDMILVVTVLLADAKRSNPGPLWLAVIGKFGHHQISVPQAARFVFER